MESKDRKILQHNRVCLVDTIDLSSTQILDYLIQEDVLTVHMKDLIMSKPTRQEKVQALLDILPRRGSKAFGVFCDALAKDNRHLVDQLIGNHSKVVIEDEKMLRKTLKDVAKNMTKPDVKEFKFLVADHIDDKRALCDVSEPLDIFRLLESEDVIRYGDTSLLWHAFNCMKLPKLANSFQKYNADNNITLLDETTVILFQTAKQLEKEKVADLAYMFEDSISDTKLYDAVRVSGDGLLMFSDLRKKYNDDTEFLKDLCKCLEEIGKKKCAATVERHMKTHHYPHASFSDMKAEFSTTSVKGTPVKKGASNPVQLQTPVAGSSAHCRPVSQVDGELNQSPSFSSLSDLQSIQYEDARKQHEHTTSEDKGLYKKKIDSYTPETVDVTSTCMYASPSFHSQPPSNRTTNQSIASLNPPILTQIPAVSEQQDQPNIVSATEASGGEGYGQSHSNAEKQLPSPKVGGSGDFNNYETISKGIEAIKLEDRDILPSTTSGNMPESIILSREDSETCQSPKKANSAVENNGVARNNTLALEGLQNIDEFPSSSSVSVEHHTGPRTIVNEDFQSLQPKIVCDTENNESTPDNAMEVQDTINEAHYPVDENSTPDYDSVSPANNIHLREEDTSDASIVNQREESSPSTPFSGVQPEESILAQGENSTLFVTMDSTEMKLYYKDSDESIATGGFGQVYEGIKLFQGLKVVVKQQDLSKHNQSAAHKQFLQEKQAAVIKHPCILPIFALCENPSCIMYPYMENKDLERVLTATPDVLSREHRIRITYQTCEGLRHLHRELEGNKKRCIVHRDIKPANILLDENYNARLGDLGLNKQLECGKTHASLTETTGFAGTHGYRDPYNRDPTGQEYRPANDIFGIGIVMWQLLSEKPAVVGGKKQLWQILEDYTTTDELLQLKLHKESVWSKDNVTRTFIDLARQCLLPENGRITLPELCTQLHNLMQKENYRKFVSKQADNRCIACLIKLRDKVHLVTQACEENKEQQRCGPNCNYYCRSCLLNSYRNPPFCLRHGLAESAVGHSNQYALLIAGHPKPEDTEAKIFHRDAVRMKNVLTDSRVCGMKEDNVLLLTGELDRDSNRETCERNIYAALDELISKLKTGNGSLIFYYTGHASGESFLVYPGLNERVPCKDIKDKLSKMKLTNILAILDCCFSGEQDLLFPELWSRQWSSSRIVEHGGQSSDGTSKYFSGKNSIFTNFIVNGLLSLQEDCQKIMPSDCAIEPPCNVCTNFRGECSGTGIIRLDNLKQYVQAHFELIRQKKGKFTQFPTIRGEHEKDPAFAYFNTLNETLDYLVEFTDEYNSDQVMLKHVHLKDIPDKSDSAGLEKFKELVFAEVNENHFELPMNEIPNFQVMDKDKELTTLNELHELFVELNGRPLLRSRRSLVYLLNGPVRVTCGYHVNTSNISLVLQDMIKRKFPLKKAHDGNHFQILADESNCKTREDWLSTLKPILKEVDELLKDIMKNMEEAVKIIQRHIHKNVTVTVEDGYIEFCFEN